MDTHKILMALYSFYCKRCSLSVQFYHSEDRALPYIPFTLQ